MSLSLRLFGNIFGEELVILMLFSIMPFLVPLPMMLLGLVTGGLQAFIFVLLSIIYLQGAVAVEHHDDEHGHDAPAGSCRAGGGVRQSIVIRAVQLSSEEAWIVSKRAVLTFAFVLVAGFAAPLYAQGGEAASHNIEIAKWSIITAGFALGVRRRPRGARPGPRGRRRPPRRSPGTRARRATSAAPCCSASS